MRRIDSTLWKVLSRLAFLAKIPYSAGLPTKNEFQPKDLFDLIAAINGLLIPVAALAVPYHLEERHPHSQLGDTGKEKGIAHSQPLDFLGVPNGI
jgi:hypothetical protein